MCACVCVCVRACVCWWKVGQDPGRLSPSHLPLPPSHRSAFGCNQACGKGGVSVQGHGRWRRRLDGCSSHDRGGLPRCSHLVVNRNTRRFATASFVVVSPCCDRHTPFRPTVHPVAQDGTTRPGRLAATVHATWASTWTAPTTTTAAWATNSLIRTRVAPPRTASSGRRFGAACSAVLARALPPFALAMLLIR